MIAAETTTSETAALISSKTANAEKEGKRKGIFNVPEKKVLNKAISAAPHSEPVTAPERASSQPSVSSDLKTKPRVEPSDRSTAIWR